MDSYLQRLDAAAPAARWPMVRGWIFGEPLGFFDELRTERPILVLPELTLAARFDDCTEILRRHDVFSVALYKPKQGDYWMAQDDTAQHWRDKSIMHAILDREDIPAIRAYTADKAAALLAAGGSAMDAVGGLTRAVPLAFVQDWFGLVHKNPQALCRWSYWNQIDTFWNQPFDAIAWPDPAAIVAEREAANREFEIYLAELVGLSDVAAHLGFARRSPVQRLLSLSSSGAVTFNLAQVGLNVSGLLVGAIETVSHAVVNALDYLLAHPAALTLARAAAHSADPAAVDGFVFEALRFKPAFPYFFRQCAQAATLGRGRADETVVPQGTTVLALTHAAMFDPAAQGNPQAFDPTRGMGNQFHFGLGLHECLGRAIGSVMIPEIVRQALLLDGLTAFAVDRRNGPVPEYWSWSWHGAR